MIGNVEQNIAAKPIMRNDFINLITKNSDNYSSVFFIWQILSPCLSCFNKPLFTLIDNWSAQWLPLHPPLPSVKWSQVRGCSAKRLQHMKRLLVISIAPASIAIGAIPALAEVDPKIHKLCLDAKDYSGCVRTMTGKDESVNNHSSTACLYL